MKVLKIFLVIISVFVLTSCTSKKTDALKFKEEYESLNGTIGKSGKKTKSLSIS